MTAKITFGGEDYYVVDEIELPTGGGADKSIQITNTSSDGSVAVKINSTSASSGFKVLDGNNQIVMEAKADGTTNIPTLTVLSIGFNASFLSTTLTGDQISIAAAQVSYYTSLFDQITLTEDKADPSITYSTAYGTATYTGTVTKNALVNVCLYFEGSDNTKPLLSLQLVRGASTVLQETRGRSGNTTAGVTSLSCICAVNLAPTDVFKVLIKDLTTSAASYNIVVLSASFSIYAS